MTAINTQTSVNISGAINTFTDVYKRIPKESDKDELKALIRLKHDLMMEEQDRLDGRTSPSPINDAIRERAMASPPPPKPINISRPMANGILTTLPRSSGPVPFN